MAAKERYKVDTWYDVPFKDGRRSKNIGASSSKVKIIKVFVSNLPEGCSSADLVHVMKGFGVIKGTYIARKYDRLGKRFGFVSFGNVEDPVKLEENLKDVWIGSYKLYVVLARFVDRVKIQHKEAKVWKPVDEARTELRPNNVADEGKVGDNSGPAVVGTRSFRDTLLNVVPGKEVVDINVSDEVIARDEWNGLGLLGKVKDLNSLSRLRIWFGKSVSCKVGIKYVGQTWEYERIAWLKLFGIPLCLNVESFLTDISTKFGEVIQLPNSSVGDEDLSYVMVGVLTNSVHKVQQHVNLNWKSTIYPVFVDEDCEDWVPDCLNDVEEIVADEEEESGENIRIDVEEEVYVNMDSENNVVGVESEFLVENTVNVINDSQNVVRGDDHVVTMDVPSMGVKVDKEGGTKRGKGYKKKTRKKLSCSPVGHERPRKRPREGEDLFDLDRFINCVGAGPVYEECGVETGVERPNVNDEPVVAEENIREGNMDANSGVDQVVTAF
ncbi:putative RNA recognition motif domain, nucleotide-binding alpha-beta plait domain superfamily [Helianthus anomalus]